jgi:ABC-2 type transport system ATP-binding protein
MMDVLRCEAIRKSFSSGLSLKKREVIHGVSLSARTGEILGFLGPNGAGKTTMIKVILGLIKPDSGSVEIFGRRAGERSVMARIGYLPENPYFHPHLTLKEFLVFCGNLSGLGRGALTRRVEEVIEMVDLTRHADFRLKGFSKGMLQRAGLAQAILHDPDLLILDEPFSGLDPLGRIMVRDILIELRQRRKTIFFSSHILPDMEVLCDRACIIREGVITRSVGLDELLRLGEGKVEITARGGLDGIDDLGDYIELRKSTGEDLFLVVKKQEYVRPVVRRLYDAGADVLKIVNQHPSLEEVFLSEISEPGITPAAPEEAEEPVLTG